MRYFYAARSADGGRVNGSMEAPSARMAADALHSRSLFITSLEAASSPRGLLAALGTALPVSRRELCAFLRALATLVRAGVPVRRAIDIASNGRGNPRFAEVLRAAGGALEDGLSLSAALARHPREFPAIHVAMIRAGEIGGTLDDALERLASLMERDTAVRTRVLSALAYPCVVALAAAELVLFLLNTIVPTFRTMYAQMHVPLPPITAMIFGTAELLHRPVLLLWILGAAAIAAGVAACAPGRWAPLRDRALLACPGLGAIARKAALSRIARALGTMLHAGVSLPEGLPAVAGVANLAPYTRSLHALSHALENGSSIAAPLERSGLYEPLFVNMVRVGEESGSLDAMLLRIADAYAADVEAALAALSSIVEPLMILCLGSVVGTLVASIFIPLYSLIGSIK